MVRLTRFDSVDYLEDEEAIGLYLKEAIATGDKGLILYSLSQVSRARIINQITADTGMSRVEVCKMFKEGAKPTKTTVIKAAKAAIVAPVAVS